MRIGHARRSGRWGFTMVELLIVIAIIGVLVSLISAGVWKATVTANRVRNRSEISQLEIAVESFKNKFGIYPPSKILLGETAADYSPNPKDPPALAQLKVDSLQALTTIFPRLDFSKSFFIDWDGSRALTRPAVILEGDQCLVFFLGGIPQVDPNGRPFCSGFSTNPSDPTYHVQKGGDTIAPFFEFDSSRLKRTPSNYFSYRDTYGTMPYVYFSSYKTRNGYNRYGTSDCASLNVWPYAEGASAGGLNATWRYQKPSSFQIISAGADGAFGRGSDPTIPNSFWTQTNAGNSPASAGPGQDDQANFYDTTLGTPTVQNQ
jgi:prepilin-type N-terminal cleavage/methylation domain-containing protein